jgi:hypothetical protein
VNKNRDLIYYILNTKLHFIHLVQPVANLLFLTFENLIPVGKQLYREIKRWLSVLVKSLGSRSLFLFRGSEALPLARGGLSEAQGSRFEGIKEMLAALGPLVLEHYTLLLSPAAPLRASLSPAAPLRVFPPLE